MREIDPMPLRSYQGERKAFLLHDSRSRRYRRSTIPFPVASES